MVVGDVGAMGLAVSVHRVTGGPFDAHDEHGPVVEAEARAAHHTKTRDERRMGEEPAKGITIRLGEFEDARKFGTSRSREGF